MAILPRFGGVTVYEEKRDSGGMFDAQLGVEQVSPHGFIPWVSDWHGGIRGPMKPTLEAAKADLTRLFNKKYGEDEEEK